MNDLDATIQELKKYVAIWWDADEQEYIAVDYRWPYISAFGDNAYEALAELQVAISGALEVENERTGSA